VIMHRVLFSSSLLFKDIDLVLQVVLTAVLFFFDAGVLRKEGREVLLCY